MEIKKIQKVTDGWHKATWTVIELKNPGLDKVRKLFKETYEIIEEYSEEKLIPKELSGLLFEMHDFSWWVSDLEETPLHNSYKEIINLVAMLKKYFLTCDYNVDVIKESIEKINRL